jgi:hypothetical protein
MAPSQNEQAKISEIVCKVLNESYVHLQIKDFVLKEDLENDKSLVSCQLTLGEKEISLEGRGDGVVDALFCTIINELNSEYLSLNNIQLIDFILKAKPIKKGFGFGGLVSVDLAVANRRDKKIHFLHKSKSIIGAIIQVVQKTIEYFINSELAVIQLKKSLQNAKERNRIDLVAEYTRMMTELVKNMTYNKIITEEK